MRREGLHIRLKDTAKLYEALRASDIFTPAQHVGDAALVMPFMGTTTFMASDGDRYGMITEAYAFCDDFILSPLYALRQRFKVREHDCRVYILNSEGQDEFVLAPRKMYGGLLIGFGTELLHGLESGARCKKLKGSTQFMKALRRYRDVVETAINGVYAEHLMPLPKTTMTWSGTPAPEQDISAIVSPPPPENIPGMHSTLTPEQIDHLKQSMRIPKPAESFEDVGGQEAAKTTLENMVFALKNPASYLKWGTRPPKGVLLYGPPGTGKTLLAKALAHEADAAFYRVRLSDVVSKWYGEGEKLMQAVFDLARQEERAILFFDEIDALASTRDDSHEATQRLVSTLLVNLDGIEANDRLMVVAATNRIDSIDPAFKRPERIDTIIKVAMPDAAARQNIFKIHQRTAVKNAERELFEPMDYASLIDKTQGYSGADIAEIIRRSLEDKALTEARTKKDQGLVSLDDILRNIKNYERDTSKKKLGFR